MDWAKFSKKGPSHPAMAASKNFWGSWPSLFLRFRFARMG